MANAAVALRLIVQCLSRTIAAAQEVAFVGYFVAALAQSYLVAGQ